jgi:hypothetical protein
MHPVLLTVVAAVILGAASVPSMASGSYPGPGIRPPAKYDTAKYELGKAVFTGKAPLTVGAGNAETQGATLKDWQKALPVALQRTTDLPAMAGKLTSGQLDGLQHFLEVRYNLKKAAK